MGSADINAIPTRLGLILARMERLPWNQATKRSSISITTDGRSIAAVFFNYRWLLELRFRQGQVRLAGGWINKMVRSYLWVKGGPSLARHHARTVNKPTNWGNCERLHEDLLRLSFLEKIYQMLLAWQGLNQTAPASFSDSS